MKVALGEIGLKKTWQTEFPKTTRCCNCGGNARIAFVAHEGMDNDDQPIIPRNTVQYVTDIHKNEGAGNFWPHDCIAVAVYFCRDCFEPVAMFNQA